MKVLITEPDESISSFLTMLLDGLDIEFEVILDINEAKKSLQTGEINLVVTESKISDKSSVELYRFIKQEQLPIGFALFTSRKLNELTEFNKFLREGDYNFFIQKPYKDAEFLEVIEKIEDNIDSITPPKQDLPQENHNIINDRLEGKIGKSDQITNKDYALDLDNNKEESKDLSIELDSDQKSKELAISEDSRGDHQGAQDELQQAPEESPELEIELDKDSTGSQLDYTDKAREESPELEIDLDKNKHTEDLTTNSSPSDENNLTGNINKTNDGNDAAKKRERKYQPIKIKRFFNFNRLPFPVYLKLDSGKQIKIIHENDDYKAETIEKYQEKNVKELYINALDYKDFINLFTARISHKLNLAPKNRKNFIASQLILADMIFEEINELGISQDVYYKTKEVVQSLMDYYRKDITIAKMLGKLAFGSDYISKHSIHLVFITCELCDELSWDNIEIRQKLCMAAMLHDIGFQDSELASVMDTENEDISTSDKEQIIAHPVRTVNILKKVKDINEDILTIISNHHERPDGTGFPERLNATQITPMSALFIIAHEYSAFIHNDSKIGHYSDPVLFYQYLNKNYDRGNFRSVLKAFKARFSDLFSI